LWEDEIVKRDFCELIAGLRVLFVEEGDPVSTTVEQPENGHRLFVTSYTVETKMVADGE